MRTLSNSSEAIRKRRQRDKKAEVESNAAKGSDLDRRLEERKARENHTHTPPASLSWHDTAPISLSGSADERPFTSSTRVLLDGTGGVEESAPDAPSAPIAGEPPPPEPEEAKPGMSEAEARAMAQIVGAYVRMGMSMMLAKHPEQLRAFAQVPMFAAALENSEKIFTWIDGCIMRTCMKHDISIPYVDEGVSVLAIGIASAGFVVKPSKEAQRQAAAQARDANPQAEPEPPPMAANANGVRLND